MARNELKEAGFAITGGKGFHVRFANGWTVSVQFGHGNYCEHYNSPRGVSTNYHSSADAEIAARDKDGNWFQFEDGSTVWGNATPPRVLATLAEAAAL